MFRPQMSRNEGANMNQLMGLRWMFRELMVVMEPYNSLKLSLHPFRYFEF